MMSSMYGYCGKDDLWFEIFDPQLDASYLCPNCLTPAIRSITRLDTDEPVVESAESHTMKPAASPPAPA